MREPPRKESDNPLDLTAKSLFTNLAEWWTDRSQAWVHYVPVKIDYTDLHDAFLFVSSPPVLTKS